MFSAFFRGQSISGFLRCKFARILRPSLMHWIATAEKDTENNPLKHLRRIRNLLLLRLLSGQVENKTEAA